MTGVRANISHGSILAWLPLVLVLGLLIASGCSDEKSNPTYPDPHQPQIGTWFLGVWGQHENSVFVVGQPGLIYHYDGLTKQWRREESGTTEALTDVWGDGTGTVYATGHNGVILRRSLMGTWSKMDSGTTEHLYSIGKYRDTVMAAGFKGTLRKLVGQSWVKAPELVYRRDHTDAIQDTLLLSKDIESLTIVAHHQIAGSDGVVLMEDVDADWQLRPIPGAEWVTCATSNKDSIAGNFMATDNGRLYQLSMSEQNQPIWRERYSPALGTTVYGIFIDEGDTLWAVTDDGRINRIAPPYLRREHFSEVLNDDTMFFFDIWGSSSTNVFAVGIDGCVLRYHVVDGVLDWRTEDLPDLPEGKSLATHIFDKFGRPVHR